MNPFLLPEGNVHVTISGGRTSAYLLHQLLEVNGDLPDRVRVVFANTGREDPRTLDFVQQIGERWSVPITWVQYIPEAPFFETVSHNSAARNGEPFEAMIKHKRFVPNGRKRICTEQLKVRAAKRMLVAAGWKQWTKTIGIRFDEPHRHEQDDQPREKIWMPLIEGLVTKPMVRAFWDAQPFDLPKDIKSNCRLCFQFSLHELADQMREDPDDLWPERMEELGHGTFFHNQPWASVRKLLTAQGDMFRRPATNRRRLCGAAMNEECAA